MITRLYHCAIRTAVPDRMRNFYCQVLGMRVDPRRPDVPVSGFWLRSSSPGGEALIHVFADKDAELADGSVPTESGAVHHVSYLCEGFEDIRARCERHGLAYRASILPTVGLWQLFVFDPHGILVELTFEAAIEKSPTPRIPAGLEFDARDRSWFDPQAYRVFDDGASEGVGRAAA